MTTQSIEERHQKKVINKLIKPFLDYNGILLETRMDYGCCLNETDNNKRNNSDQYFVNEIEYAGGLMTFLDHTGKAFGIHVEMANQLKKADTVCENEKSQVGSSLWLCPNDVVLLTRDLTSRKILLTTIWAEIRNNENNKKLMKTTSRNSIISQLSNNLTSHKS